MMKMNFIRKSNVKQLVLRFLPMLMLTFLISQQASAQCTLACNGEINISVSDSDCSVLLTADMIVNGAMTSCPAATSYEVVITYEDGTSDGGPLPYMWANAMDFIHQKVSISIKAGGVNTCWGWANIEDKLAPKITCENIMDVVPCCGDELLVDPGTSPGMGMTGSGICAMTGSGMAPCVVECSPYDWVVLSQVTIPNTCNGTICPSYSKVIVRELVAVDAWGRVSEDTLTQQIKVKRVDISIPGTILCPVDYKGTDALSCETLPEETILLEEVQVPAPTLKGGGLPSLVKGGDTIPLFPLNAGDSLTTAVFQNCNIGVRYEDRLIPKVGKGNCAGYTLVRNWIISEWACPEQLADTCTQVFELVDNEGPTLVAGINDFEGSTNGYTCEGLVYVPAPTYADKCSGLERIDVTYPGGFIENYGKFLNEGNAGIALPLGTNEVIFIAYDACHNVSEPDTVIVDVWDKTPPVVICDEHTVVSLADKGQTSVPAASFDGGSYDDCGIMEMYARRMDTTCGCTIPEYSTFSYLGEYEGGHYYLSNRAFKRDIAMRKATAMGAGVFDFETVDGKSAEREFVVGNLPSGIGPVIMTPNTEAEGRYILEVSDLCQVFRETIEFCCEDPQTQMITLRACDHQGNYNDCMFEVELQNKIPPKILHCPVDIMVSCGVNLDFTNDLNDIFGTLVSEDSDVSTYSFMGDPDADGGFLAVAIGSQPDTICNGGEAKPYDIWDGQYWDNCGGGTISVFNDDKRNKCGIGIIDRVFSLYNGTELVGTCTQEIEIKTCKAFNFDSIEMPLDTTVLACGLPEDYGPDVTGYPEILEGQCDLVGFNYTDQTFLFNDYSEGSPACFKIIRTWQFIDWCSFEGSTNQPYPAEPYEQIIKVRDTDAPEILFSCDERSECTYDPDCETGYIELLKTAVDGCTGTDHLKWDAEVVIDIKADVNVVDTSFVGTGNLANASAHYPVGKHMVRWTFLDRCGNFATCDQIFVIKNCKAATPYCIDGLVVDLMPVDNDGDGDPDSGMVELWASDFDLGSSHPCGYPVILSFSEDITDTNRTFDCDYRTRIDVRVYSSVVIGEGAHEEIVQSYCETHLRIQDNNNVCNGRGTISEAALISGLITTEMNQSLAEAEVNLDGSELVPVMTNDIGEYAFPQMPLGGEYAVAPKKDDDHMNGVSTLDLVMIQKHILGLQLLEGPYKQIAADINRDQNISASDLVELRKLILGNIDKFRTNDSWRFVDKAYEFSDQSNPLYELFAEAYEIPALDQDMAIDFTAVKIGDVNNSITLSNYQSTEVRSNTSLVLNTTPEVIGDVLKLPVTAAEARAISGLQFTLDFGNTGLAFATIEGGKFKVDATNMGLNSIDRGMVAFSWNTSELIELSDSEVLFTIVMRGSDTRSLEQLTITSDIATAEAYTVNNEIMSINMDVTGDQLNAGFALNQNTPNPFNDKTVISFTLPEAMSAKLKIHDVTGKIVREYKGTYSAGINSIEISRSDLLHSGVLYYTLMTDNYSATKRMVILE